MSNERITMHEHGIMTCLLLILALTVVLLVTVLTLLFKQDTNDFSIKSEAIINHCLTPPERIIRATEGFSFPAWSVVTNVVISHGIMKLQLVGDGNQYRNLFMPTTLPDNQ